MCSSLGSSVSWALVYNIGGPGFNPWSDPIYFLCPFTVWWPLWPSEVVDWPNKVNLDISNLEPCETRNKGKECSSLGGSVGKAHAYSAGGLFLIPIWTLNCFSFQLHMLQNHNSQLKGHGHIYTNLLSYFTYLTQISLV